MFIRFHTFLTLSSGRLHIFSARHLSRAWPLHSRMESAVVRCLPGEPKLTISFILGGSQKHMQRDQDEPLGKALTRISHNFAKDQRKAKKSKKHMDQQASESPEVTPVKLIYEGHEVAETVLNSDAWQDGAVLQVGDVQYSIQRNAPSFITAELPVSMLSDFPVCPKLEMEFGNLQECDFSWFKEKCTQTRYLLTRMCNVHMVINKKPAVRYHKIAAASYNQDNLFGT